jgi:diguanylate cyclase (GGDEF)-like protein
MEAGENAGETGSSAVAATCGAGTLQSLHGATLDKLTGLPSLPELPSLLEEMAQEGGRSAGIWLDVDALWVLTAELGHIAVDTILRSLARWLREQAEGAGGRVVRVQGDEFLVLLPAWDLAAAEQLAVRLVNASATLALSGEPGGDHEPHVTLSAAVHEILPFPGKEAWREHRERMLDAIWEVKRSSGRSSGVVARVPPDRGTTPR